MAESIHFETDESGIVAIRINRPDKSVNALNGVMRRELSEAIDRIAMEKGVRGVMFVSEKPTTFLAGADLAELQTLGRDQVEQFLIDGQDLLARIENLKAPTVAVLNGHCLGGGLEISLACHYRVAADLPQLLIGLPEVALGLIPAWGGTVRLPRLIGLQQAAPLILTGAKFAPREALDLGIIDSVAPADQLLAVARDLLCSLGTTTARKADHAVNTKAGMSAFETVEIARQEAFSQPDLPVAVIDRLAEVLVRGAVDAAEGFEAEREIFMELIDAPEARERLLKFAPKK